VITIATLSDEMIEGQRRAKGRKIRKIVAICVDNYNIMVADGSDPEKLVGRGFVGKLAHLPNCLKDYGFDDVDFARKQLIQFFEQFTGSSVDDLTWKQMDVQFKVPKRRNDSSGILELYDVLKQRGWTEAGEVAEAA
jgi:hypothetical protein